MLAPAAGQAVSPGQIADQTGSDPANKWNSPGSVKLTINGAGTVALTGANAFSGGMNIYQGTVLLGAANAAGTGNIAFKATSAASR